MLGYCKIWKTRHNCNLKLFNQYCEHFQVNPQDIKGVELIDFPQLETFYETELFVMFLKQDFSAETIYLSQTSFPSKIYFNLYQNHLSLITDIKMYSKQFICNRCQKVFAVMWNLKQHESKCDANVKYAGKTFIRNNPNKPCQKIIGYNLAMGQDFPAGYPLIRRQEKFFVREFPQFSGGCHDWIDWLIHDRKH